MNNNTALSNTALLACLQRVLDYAQPSEERDWNEQGKPGANFHIVQDMRALRNWLAEQSATPDSAAAAQAAAAPRSPARAIPATELHTYTYATELAFTIRVTDSTEPMAREVLGGVLAGLSIAQTATKSDGTGWEVRDGSQESIELTEIDDKDPDTVEEVAYTPRVFTL